MESVGNEIFRAGGYLIISGIIYFAWNTAREETIKGSFKEILFKGLCWCAGIAFFASITLGNPTCEEQVDPVYGGCSQYADNGFEPTTEQRTASFAYYMTLFFIPVVIGTFKGKKEKEIAEYLKNTIVDEKS